MWILKLNLLLIFFSFLKQEDTGNIFIQTGKKIEKQTFTLWCNVSFTDQESFEYKD